MTDFPQEAKTFTDRLGGVWDITLTMGAARRVEVSDFSIALPKGEKISLIEPDKNLFSQILINKRLLVTIIWAIVQPQVETILGISPKENYEEAEISFADRMDGKSIESAREVFWETLMDFFPDERIVLSTLMKHFLESRKKIESELKGMDKEIRTVLDKEIEIGTKKLIKEMRGLEFSQS